jgi:flagellar FliL protein
MEEKKEHKSKSEEAPPKPKGGLIKEMIVYIGAMFVMTIIAVVMVTILFKGDAKGVAIAPETVEGAHEGTQEELREALPQKSHKGSQKNSSKNSRKGGHGSNSATSKDDPVYTFETVAVNTADMDTIRYLTVKAHVVFWNLEVKTELEESEALKAQIQDLLITVFSSKTAAELQSNEVKDQLKEFLTEELDHILGQGSVKQVFFSEYVLQ